MHVQNRVRRRAVALAAGASASLVITVMANGAFAAPTPKPTAQASNATCAPQKGVTASSISVDIVASLTGPSAATNQGFDQAVRLRFDQENAKGGINGRKIKVNAVYDDQGSGTTATTLGNKIVSADQIFGVVHGGGPDTIFPLLKSDNVPVTGQRSSNAYSTDRNVFGNTGAFSTRYATTSWSVRLKQAGATKVAGLGLNSPSVVVSINNIYNALPLFGIQQSLKLLDLPAGNFDATSTALRVKQSGADSIMSLGTTDGNVSIYQALKQQGVPITAYLTSGFTDPALVTKLGSSIEGIYSSTNGAVPFNVAVRAMTLFQHAMKAAGLNPYSPTSPLGYVAGDLFVRGLKEAGKCPTRQTFIDNLRKVNNFKGQGLLMETVSYRPGLTPNGNPPHCSWYSRVVNGVLVPDPKATCGEKFYDNETNSLVNG